MRPASLSDFDVVCDVTSQAFDDDPVLGWMFRKDHRQSDAVKLFFRTLAQMLYFPAKEVYVNEAGTGATMWLGPGDDGSIGLFDQLKTAPIMMTISGLTGIPRLLRVQSFLEKKHPKVPHYYLFTIASRPDLQGQGIGSALMEPMTHRFDEQQVPAYLENSRAANLPFYRRHGFEVTEEIRLPGGGPPMWLMTRKPR